MSDIFDDNNDNEDIEFADKDWTKMVSSVEKDGLRDGLHEGRESGRQQGFDFGYQLSFTPFFTISSIEAIIDVLLFKAKDNTEIVAKLKTIKEDLKQLYKTFEKHFLDTNESKSDFKSLDTEMIDSFETTKHNLIKICIQFDFKPVLQLINDLAINSQNN